MYRLNVTFCCACRIKTPSCTGWSPVKPNNENNHVLTTALTQLEGCICRFLPADLQKKALLAVKHRLTLRLFCCSFILRFSVLLYLLGKQSKQYYDVEDREYLYYENIWRQTKPTKWAKGTRHDFHSHFPPVKLTAPSCWQLMLCCIMTLLSNKLAPSCLNTSFGHCKVKNKGSCSCWRVCFR